MAFNLAIIGCGMKASQYIATWIERDDVAIISAADPSTSALENIKEIAKKANKSSPALYTDWRDMLHEHQKDLNSVYICTPHASHAEQALSALNLGLHVLLEKPMVTSVNEANSLLAAQQKSQKSLVVAYQGGLSPLVHQLRQDIRDKKYGELVSLSAAIWENWGENYRGHWKQQPAISGGGFMFDTGAHMMNTVSMLCTRSFASVAAKMKNRNFPVDMVTGVVGELSDGTLFTMHACGQSIRCTSRIECYFTHAIVRICAWGRWMEVEDADGNIQRFEQEGANNLLNVFSKVIAGEAQNPSDIKQGLHMAKLWDAVKLSAAKGGQPVDC